MALDSKLQAELKEALLKEKTELEENLGRIAKPTDDKGDYKTSFEDIGRDIDDNITEVEQYTDNLSIEQTLAKRLKDINDALARMENGTYGICAECNTEIETERLRANPAARRCIECKKKATN
jgi:DnaK suppressor protein